MLVAQSHLTLCDPTDPSGPPLSRGILQARMPFLGIFTTQGSNPGLLHCRRIVSYEEKPPCIPYPSVCLLSVN